MPALRFSAPTEFSAVAQPATDYSDQRLLILPTVVLIISVQTIVHTHTHTHDYRVPVHGTVYASGAPPAEA